MKNAMIVSGFLLFSGHLFAQKAAKSAYVELGGAGLASVNYDMRFMKKEDGLGFRVGLGGFSINNGPGYGKTTALFVPLGLNYLIGKDSKHYFELGGGATIASAKETYNNSSIYSNNDSKFNETFGHLYFGYRVQPKEGGFLFRAGLTPVFGKGFFIPYWAGISFGYKF